MAIYHKIFSEKAPKAIGCYSQALRTGNTVFLSGQIGLDPNTLELVTGGVEAQIDQLFNNMLEVIQQAGGTFANIVKLTVYLTDLKDFKLLNEKMSALFHEPYPARTTVQVAGLPKGAAIEIEAIVVL